MVCHVHTSADTLALANGPVLRKGLRSVDRRFINALRSVDVVCATICLNGTLVRRATGWIVSAKRFDDIVLDEWIPSPAVHGQITVAAGIEGSRVVDGSEIV